MAYLVGRNWPQLGMKVIVRNAPTAFGPMACEITSRVADGETEAIDHLSPAGLFFTNLNRYRGVLKLVWTRPCQVVMASLIYFPP
jgi:hypothetical protein